MTDTDLKTQMIVIDGVDGSGKGVQSRRLLKALTSGGYDTVLTREPGGSPAAEDIRHLLVTGDPQKWDSMTELMLMYAARRAHLRDTVWPALADGKWVISDRFADSSRAFQGIAGEAGLEVVEQVHRIVVGDFEPSLVLILDLPENTALQRTFQRGGDENRFEMKGEAYHARVRNAFLQIAAQNPQRYKVIDADQDVESVGQNIISVVNQHFAINLTNPSGDFHGD